MALFIVLYSNINSENYYEALWVVFKTGLCIKLACVYASFSSKLFKYKPPLMVISYSPLYCHNVISGSCIHFLAETAIHAIQ